MIMNLENCFERMCKRDKLLEYFHVYWAGKLRLKKNYYDFISRKLPCHTDHGIGHVDRILEKLYDFLIPHLPFGHKASFVSGAKEISLNELNLLINAVIWHDLGNLYNREGHAAKLRKLFNYAKGCFYDDHNAEWILKIVEAHSGRNAIDNCIDRSQVTFDNYTIYPAFLASLLRISDEIEEDHRRGCASDIRIKKKSEAYWEFCRINESIKPVYEQAAIDFVLKIKISAKLDKNQIWSLWGKKRNTVICIEEYIDRIEKMNNERIYCNKFLKDSTIYFKTIDCIELCMHIYDGQRVTKEINFTFDNQNRAREFFRAHTASLNTYRHRR